MPIELSVGDVRQALARVSGPNAAGSGESASLLCGKLFHEIFAELVSVDPAKSGLRAVIEGPPEIERRTVALIEHAWRKLLAPRLRRHAALLKSSTSEVLVLWRATQRLASWFTAIVVELAEQHGQIRSSLPELAKLLTAEVPLDCELVEPGWREPVRLVGIADSILRVPSRARYCAIELKLGRATPVVDLGQAALYHLILSRSRDKSPDSALALMRFSPELEELLVEAEALQPAQQRLIALIGKLAGVTAEGVPIAKPSGNGQGAPAAQAPRQDEGTTQTGEDRYGELAKRLVRAYREQGVGIELRGAPLIGPRFLRFDVRLSSGLRLDGLRKRTAEVQHRLELQTEPLIVKAAGHLHIDVERPDPETVAFAGVTAQLPLPQVLLGSAKLPLGVDAGGQLHFADLASAGRSHVLVAGTTGSGKSEWLRMALAGLAASNTPDTLRLVTLDPKLNAFSELEGSRLLLNRDAWWIPRQGGRPASEVLQELIEEMERRYQLVRQTGSDNLSQHVQKTGEPLPRIVCVCDEYFALISQSREEKRQIEDAVSLLGAKARAAGIHLILATQQPSRQSISGAIQSNLPCRVALLLKDAIESRMILGSGGAERLTGSGDLLYKDFGDPIRLQAPLLTPQDRAHYLRPRT